MTTESIGGLRLPRETPVWLRGTGLAFLYWFLFLVALEPGNILHARSMGRSLEFETELLRITVAALLGCSTAPLVIGLTRRFPFSAERLGRHLAIHAGAAALLSVVLILVSCVLAAWVLLGQTVPALADIRSQLAANWLLLTFVLVGFAVMAHSMKLAVAPPPRAGAARSIPVKSRGRLSHVDLASIEWIESQGNYLALHVGGRSHLVRETLQNFAGRLDAARFVRVHRRVIVAIDQVREIQPLANGDSTLTLLDGSTLRASRSYREALRQRWAQVQAQGLPKDLPRSES